jgi:hypothetical protein
LAILSDGIIKSILSCIPPNPLITWKAISQCFLDKSDRQKEVFDEMLFDIPTLFITACSNSLQLVPLHPIVMSTLFHRYKVVKACMAQVEGMRRRVKVQEGLQKIEEDSPSQSRLFDF